MRKYLPYLLGVMLFAGLTLAAGGSSVTSGHPLVSGGPSAAPGTVTAPATGAGVDTCTGGGCAIGASGISTDGGIQLGGISAGPTAGMYQPAAATVGFSIAGTEIGRFNANGMLMASGYVVNFSGSDSFSYIYRSNSNVLRVGTSGQGGSLAVSGALVSDGTTTLTGAVTASSTANKGTLTLSGGGTNTVTVTAGTKCVCSYETAGVIDLTCVVASTTLTATGTAAANVSYICL